MALPENSAFKPALDEIIKLDPEQARLWRAAKISFCENNGIDWPGNAFLYTQYNGLENLESQLKPLGINWQDHATLHDGYWTECFGFDDHNDFIGECAGIDDETLELCAGFLEELGIEWNGWTEPPTFNLIATEQQILALTEKLAPFIVEWKQENGYS